MMRFMKTKGSIFLDTNILVYMSDVRSTYFEDVIKFFQEYLENDFWISRQVLREYAVVMTRNNNNKSLMKAEEVVKEIKYLNDNFYVADEYSDVTDILLHLIKKYQLQGKRIHDANIVATMVSNQIENLYTLNIKDFKSFDEINLIKI